ncbi:unnamed protein product [Amoebophrya sp. A120]|nr:unnamed protein product [Amoebophrya sp. A120]|eukprot:GSA120T00008430001.1
MVKPGLAIALGHDWFSEAQRSRLPHTPTLASTAPLPELPAFDQLQSGVPVSLVLVPTASMNKLSAKFPTRAGSGITKSFSTLLPHVSLSGGAGKSGQNPSPSKLVGPGDGTRTGEGTERTERTETERNRRPTETKTETETRK